MTMKVMKAWHQYLHKTQYSSQQPLNWRFKLSFLVDTRANVSAIKADVWRQLPPPSKQPPKPTNSVEELANNKTFSFKTAELERENDENLVPNCVLIVLFLLIWRLIVSSPGDTPHWTFWVGVCRTVLKTLTLFQTKMYDFSYPFSDLTPKI